MDLFFALNHGAAAAGLCRSAGTSTSQDSLTCPHLRPPDKPTLIWAFSPTAVASPGCILPGLRADGGWMAADGAPWQENAATEFLFMVHCKRNSGRLTFFGAWGWNFAGVRSPQRHRAAFLWQPVMCEGCGRPAAPAPFIAYCVYILSDIWNNSKCVLSATPAPCLRQLLN